MAKGLCFKHKRVAALCAALAGLAVSQQANAAAFALKEQATTYLGYAFAGTASSSLDASSNFYNPAGMSELKHSQVLGSVVYIHGVTELYNAVARNTAGAVVTVGNRPTKPKITGWVPGVHIAWRYNRDWVLGFSVCAPFGLSTIYGNYDMARYVATKSKVTTEDLSPGVSYRINDAFSVGAAFDAMHVKATLANNTQILAPGFISNEASGWTYGMHAGVLYKPSCKLKMGLTYFSPFNAKVDGNVATQGLLPPSNLRTTDSASLKLPDRFVYSLTYQYNEQWGAMADVEWTHWSRTQWLRIDYNTGQSALEYFYYKNTWRFALGTDYKPCKNLLVKAGISYEQTPTNDVYRSARLPENNRYWLAFGVDYAFNRCISIDAGYAHVFAHKVSVNQRQVGTSATLRGDYKNSANLFGVQLKWNFV